MDILDILKKLVKEKTNEHGIIKAAEVMNIPLNELESLLFTKPSHKRLLFSTVIDIANALNVKLYIKED